MSTLELIGGCMDSKEFNKHCALLDGHDNDFDQFDPEVDKYFNDLNLLMPLAWKHRIELTWIKRPVYGWSAITRFSKGGGTMNKQSKPERIYAGKDVMAECVCYWLREKTDETDEYILIDKHKAEMKEMLEEIKKDLLTEISGEYYVQVIHEIINKKKDEL